MTLRKHKNNRWFRIKYHFEKSIPTGQRWTGSKMVPRSVEVKPVGHGVVFRYGSEVGAVERAFRRYQDNTIRVTCRLAYASEIKEHNLLPR
jgi:hypothetical protein